MAVLQRHKNNIYGLQVELDKIGDLSLLTTEQKDNLVNAINELNVDSDTTTLTTTNKKIVGAINELDSEIGDITTKAVTLTASDLIGLINELEGTKVNKSANLSDLADVAEARTNLDVYSKSEIESAINQASLNLGTNFTADDAADAGTKFVEGSLSVGDNIFIKDDADSKWAIYKVLEITDGAYSTSTLEKIMDEDTYLNAQSAEAIKIAYESNNDTNAFTDNDKTKVDFISITKAVDLDNVILSDSLYTDGTFASATSDKTIPSSSAVKTYVDSVVAGAVGGAVGGAVSEAIFTTETLTVVDDKITLTNVPKDGVIFNFGTVRHVNNDFVSYDIPVTVTATEGNKEFLLSPDISGQFDGKLVTVQYAYVPGETGGSTGGNDGGSTGGSTGGETGGGTGGGTNIPTFTMTAVKDSALPLDDFELNIKVNDFADRVNPVKVLVDYVFDNPLADNYLSDKPTFFNLTNFTEAGQTFTIERNALETTLDDIKFKVKIAGFDIDEEFEENDNQKLINAEFDDSEIELTIKRSIPDGDGMIL